MQVKIKNWCSCSLSVPPPSYNSCRISSSTLTHSCCTSSIYTVLTNCGYNLSEANSQQLGVMAVSEKCIQKGPPKMTGGLRHSTGLQASHKRTVAPLNKYGMFSPYKQQLFDLVLSGLLAYNPYLSA